MQQEQELKLIDIITIIKEWLIFLRSKIVYVLILSILGAALGVVYSIQYKSKYIASLSFALEEDKAGGGLGGALGLASSFGLDLGSGGSGMFSGNNIIELMKSRRLIEKTLLNGFDVGNITVSFAEKYIQVNQWREKWEEKHPELSKKLIFPVDADRSQFTLQQDSVLGLIYHNLTKNGEIDIVQKDKKVSILTIYAKSTNELFAKKIAESLAKEVSEFYIDTKSKKAKMNVEILQKQTDSVRAELNGSITKVAQANDMIYNSNPAMSQQRVPSTKKQVDVQANTAILTQLVVNLELAKVSLRKETPLIQIIDMPILPLTQDRLGKHKALMIGGILSGILAVVFFTIQRIWVKIIKEA